LPKHYLITVLLANLKSILNYEGTNSYQRARTYEDTL